MDRYLARRWTLAAFRYWFAVAVRRLVAWLAWGGHECSNVGTIRCVGYSKRDGLPRSGARSRVLRVRIGTVEHDDLKHASNLEGVSVSEFIRRAGADHAKRVQQRQDVPSGDGGTQVAAASDDPQLGVVNPVPARRGTPSRMPGMLI